MDFLTAGIALTATLFCVALVMGGICVAAPEERCTRYWAGAEALIASGVLLLTMHAGEADISLALATGNLAVIAGGILQWWGVQSFFREQPRRAGWALIAAHALLLTVLAAAGASRRARLVLFACTLLTILVLTLRTLLRHAGERPTFGYRVVSGAVALLIVNNLLRLAVAAIPVIDLQPASASSGSVALLYLVPLGGILLYATGILVLYFERTVNEKHHLATHDELTGLLNRRALLSAGEREVALARRNGQPLAVALLDIDHFKIVNDRLGHDAGDCVLRDIGALLQDCCRSIDFVGRYGGEEFCVILPNVDIADCATIGERLMEAVRQYRYRGDYPVTLSAGFAVSDPGHAQQSWQELVHRADQQLYKAKDGGRNGYCIEARTDRARAIGEPEGGFAAAMQHDAVQ